MIGFVDGHRERFGVEPICRELQIAPSTYYDAKRRIETPCARVVRDQQLLVEIRRVYAQSRCLYGARKVWAQLGREEIKIGKCTVERLMRCDGLKGVVRGKKKWRTTFSTGENRAQDLVNRQFSSKEPNRLWVSDFTYVKTKNGVVYVAFVIDAFSRRIVGWKADTSMQTQLVTDALEMALYDRNVSGRVDGDSSLICHSDAGSQYTSYAFTDRLTEIGATPSIGTVGDAYDNALAESTIGLYKTELINHDGPWDNLSQIEFATLEWIDWYNHRRIHTACQNQPPAEYETNKSLTLTTK